MLGTAHTVSSAYGLALAGALWAAFEHAWWLVVVFSVLGGIGYAAAGRHWWAGYRRDPASNSGGDSAVWLAVLACVAGAGMVALVIGA